MADAIIVVFGSGFCTIWAHVEGQFSLADVIPEGSVWRTAADAKEQNAPQHVSVHRNLAAERIHL
jgi:hypothetical protein